MYKKFNIKKFNCILSMNIIKTKYKINFKIVQPNQYNYVYIIKLNHKCK